ncbi:MAG: hypothetical protein HCA25_24170 [Dolichospermum sp. DET50]|nr:hypothetical protein [Dolichospermum sp. DET66]MBS3035251.1 hypothetical protein [Dolichospermum sp. DET67]MBS3040451.1 hypothetical protein [Dolichospermum sp. DET50]QSX67593.1 MAG: hypothetical protein EZY12_23445 [Dolichospermum sp. DET69]
MSSQFSQEHQNFSKSCVCPLCKYAPSIPKYFTGNGEKINAKELLIKNDLASYAKCNKCEKTWNIFFQLQSSSIIIPNSDNNTPVNDSTISTIIEADNFIENVRTDQSLIANPTRAKITRKITSSLEWSQTYTVEYEKTRTIGGELAFEIFKFIHLPNFKLKVDYAIKDKYSFAENSKQTHSNEVIIEVPEYTSIRVYLYWKLLLRKGLIQFRDSNGGEFKVPFQAVIGSCVDCVQSVEK